MLQPNTNNQNPTIMQPALDHQKMSNKQPTTTHTHTTTQPPKQNHPTKPNHQKVSEIPQNVTDRRWTEDELSPTKPYKTLHLYRIVLD